MSSKIDQTFCVPSTHDITDVAGRSGNVNTFRRYGSRIGIEEKIDVLETIISAMLDLLTDQQRYDLFVKINGQPDPDDHVVYVNAPVNEE